MPKKIVLAYSGGLDTSVILKWLQLKFDCPVVTFTADIGQVEELEHLKTRAKSLGVNEIFIEDLKEEFVKLEENNVNRKKTPRKKENCISFANF